MVRRITVSLPSALIDRVKEQAEEDDVKTSWLVKQALKEYLGEEEETEESEETEDLDEEAPQSVSRKRKGNPDVSQIEDAIDELKEDISDIKEAIASFVGLKDKVKERKVAKPKAEAEEDEEHPWWAWDFEGKEEEAEEDGTEEKEEDPWAWYGLDKDEEETEEED